MSDGLREEIKFGEIEMFLPKSTDAIATARKLLNLFEEGIEKPDVNKKILEVAKVKSAPSLEEKFIETGEIQKLPTAQDILIEKFPFDKSQEKSFKTLFFIELDDGRAVLSYMQGRCYTTKENVLKLPYPVPNGYLKLIKVPNKITALRMYRECLAGRTESPRAREEEKPHPVPLFNGNKNKIVLNGFIEAPRFDYLQVAKQTLGKSIFWELNGCIAIKKTGGGNDIVFATKEQINVIKKLDKEALKEYIKNLNIPKQYVLREFIENLKDDAAGILPKVNPDIKGSHGEDFEKFGGM